MRLMFGSKQTFDSVSSFFISFEDYQSELSKRTIVASVLESVESKYLNVLSTVKFKVN